MYIKFAKTRDNAFIPERANPSDAGVDIRTPEKVVLEALEGEYREPYYQGYDDIPLTGENSQIISTGLKVEIPHGYMLEIKNKSSIGSLGIIVGACIIDSGYEGELKVNLINVSAHEHIFSVGDKIAQAVLTPIMKPAIIEVDEDNLYRDISTMTNRGEGGFGSTGK